MRDVAGRTTQLLLGRDDADSVTWQDARTLPGQRWMRDATSVFILPVSQTPVYGGVTEHANIGQRCADLRLHLRRRSNLCRGTFRENYFGKCEHSLIW